MVGKKKSAERTASQRRNYMRDYRSSAATSQATDSTKEGDILDNEPLGTKVDYFYFFESSVF